MYHYYLKKKDNEIVFGSTGSSKRSAVLLPRTFFIIFFLGGVSQGPCERQGGEAPPPGATAASVRVNREDDEGEV